MTDLIKDKLKIYIKDCELILKLLIEYDKISEEITFDLCTLPSNIIKYDTFKNVNILSDKKQIIKNNNIVLTKYLKINNINIDDIDNNILIIFNLLSEELLQVYDTLEKIFLYR